MSPAVEVRVVSLVPYGGPRHARAFTLPDSVPLRPAIKARKFVRVFDRNWKSKCKFLR